MARVLVVSPHPDDEAIGCGGTIRAHVLAGDRVETIFLTSGERGVTDAAPDVTAALREAEAAGAARVLGVGALDFWRQPDGRLRATPALVARLADRLRCDPPDRVYVTGDRESHSDHRAAAKLVRGALRAAAHGAAAPVVLMYEVWTPLARIDVVVDISAHIDTKRAAIRAHASQIAIMRFDEAACALARYRGEMHSWPGGSYAEVFTRMRP